MITTQKTIWCDEDDCEEWTQWAVTANELARKTARDKGWACHSGGDFCPEHNTKP